MAAAPFLLATKTPTESKTVDRPREKQVRGRSILLQPAICWRLVVSGAASLLRILALVTSARKPNPVVRSSIRPSNISLHI
ncbi:hypothetical protein HO173_012746 [Letharia columbiana]|uniref:Uncharacterized protein n=1 Tax=Letharia columbiana TaxID=112416 RepID=A0A8H6CL66_9LECA|nr:uncharacterized protein HO173_012746 [Letharia columbiana]KAF6225417.1 hypothetical protein HO173_012746 [Letharia columbiana]